MTYGSTGTPERSDPPGMHDGWHMDATEAFVIISDLKAEIAALNKEGAVMQDTIGRLKAEIDYLKAGITLNGGREGEIARLEALAVSEYGRGYADGSRCAECIKVFACDDCPHRRSNA
jgi:hypothetical protein